MKGRRRSGLKGVVALILACSLLAASPVGADDVLNIDVADAFDFAGTQLDYIATEVLTETGVFTDYTDTDGVWQTEKESGDTIDQTVWTSGMVAGMYWYQYEATGALVWKTAAEFFQEGLEGVEDLDDNDLGFQVLNSFGLGYRLTSSATEKEAYATRVLAGAASLYDYKWAADIPAFWSWANPSSRPDWDRAVNVDMIMNMEIMLWASENGGPATYASAVASHADTTWADIVRNDNSTYHVADYDIETGELVDQGTYQGYTDDSTWTRGQAWAVYGFLMVYRYVQEPRFLSMSLGVFAYWEDNLPTDLIPPADFDAPTSATNNGKDSSATAVVASALLELFIVTEDPTYLVKGQNYLKALLSGTYFQPDATDGYQSILRRTTGRWGEEEVGAVFGDYFLLEAMVRYKNLSPCILLWEEPVVEVTAATPAGTTSSDSGSRRGLQAVAGGTFCGLTSNDGVIEFADPDCVPVAPDFDALEGSTSTTSSLYTPSPIGVDTTVSPSAASTSSRGIGETLAPSSGATPVPSGGGTPAPSVTMTIAPSELESTRSPGATLSPTAGVTLAPSTAAPSAIIEPTGNSSAVYNELALDSDLDMSYLNAASPVTMWLSVTLSNVLNTPATLVLENSAGETMSLDVVAPAGGWNAGGNTVSFSALTDVVDFSTWGTVVGVAMEFERSTSASLGAVTEVTVNWLILGHALEL